MRRFAVLATVLGAALLALAACSKGAPTPPGADQTTEAAAAPKLARDAATATADKAQPAAPPAQSAAAPVNPAAPMLAYTYDYGIEAPPAKIRPLMGAEQAACVAAGMAVCQVTAAESQAEGPDQVTAKLSFRATPAWLKDFETKLARDAGDAGGRLVHSAVTSEDLTRDIVDTDASVKAKTTLRDRLQTLLETHPGKIEDLLAVEQALATAQDELDQTTSELAVMRERVATSEVTIEYDSAGVLAPRGVWSPVTKAVSSVVGVLAGSVATIIYLAAAILPWALVLGGLLWLFRKRLPRLGRRRPPEPPPAAAPKA